MARILWQEKGSHLARALVPVETEPSKVLDDASVSLFGNTTRVGVLHPEDEGPVVMAGVET